MVSGLQFVETCLFWTGITLLFAAFVSACMESRHSGDVDVIRSRLGSKFEFISRIPITLMLITSLRMLRDTIDHIVTELLTDFEVSPLSAPIVMAVISVLLPIAAAINALLGGGPFLVIVYLIVGGAFLVLGLWQSARRSTIWFGIVSVSATFALFVLGPFYAAQSLTDHILSGTFSHSVLGSLLIVVVLYAGCAGAWLLYRSIRNVDTLSSIDRAVARFLFAVPCMYILYWFGLLAGHLAINEPSPSRQWVDLASAVVVGAVAFVAVLSTIEIGVLEKRRGHGLAVILAAGVVSLIGVVAINGLISQELPFWLRFWLYDFSPSDIVLGSQFWVSHTSFFLWVVMLLFVLFIGVARFVIVVWPGGPKNIKEKPFLGLSGVCVVGAILVFTSGSLIDVYVNVN